MRNRVASQFTQRGDVGSVYGGVQVDSALEIDHDHQTGRVRGLLCHKCNTMLGMAADNPRWLQKAIEYLKN
jgi:hypothetical protein